MGGAEDRRGRGGPGGGVGEDGSKEGIGGEGGERIGEGAEEGRGREEGGVGEVDAAVGSAKEGLNGGAGGGAGGGDGVAAEKEAVGNGVEGEAAEMVGKGKRDGGGEGWREGEEGEG